MTHNIHPFLHRVAVNKNWKSKWFSDSRGEYCKNFRRDHFLRIFLEKEFEGKSVADFNIEKGQHKLTLTIFASRPGLIIGRNGEAIDMLTKKIKTILKRKLNDTMDVEVRVEEFRFSEVSAAIAAENITEMLKKRMPFRRVLKQSLEKIMANRKVQGARIEIAGRLGGAEMSRREHVARGRVPLQTLRANIDYSNKVAILPYGCIGIKVYVYTGDVNEEN